MKYLKILLVSILLLGCSPMDLLKSGPMLNTNAQLGQQNNQVLGTNISKAETVDLSKNKVTGENVTVNQVSLKFLFVLILGWVLPSPNEIARKIRESKLWRKILG